MKHRGFTIVELLIVIVVIAVLASIAVVAYNGIQSRANDSAIQNDLKNFGRLMEIYKIDNGGSYPALLAPSIGIKFSRNSYGADSQGYNARYCINTTTNEYVILANSKSGNYFKYRSSDGLSSNPSTYGYGVCNLVGLSSTNPTYQNNGLNDGAWASWVN